VSLHSAFNFSLDDLETNRRGEMTEKQRTQLRLRMYATLALTLVGVLVFGGVAVFFVGVAAFIGTHTLPWLAQLIQWGLIPAMITLVSVGLYWRLKMEYHNWRQDIAWSRVVPACGRARFEVRRKRLIYQRAEWFFDERYLPGYYFTHMLIIGPQRFDLDQRQLHAFTEGESYCIYYTPKTRIILSAEGPLAKEK